MGLQNPILFEVWSSCDNSGRKWKVKKLEQINQWFPSLSFRESGARKSPHPSDSFLGEGRRKMFYLLLVLQVMKFDSEWAAEALQCNLGFDLWLIGQGFSLMDIHIKVFKMDVYFLLWLCCSLVNRDSSFFRVVKLSEELLVCGVQQRLLWKAWEGIPGRQRGLELVFSPH